MSTIPETAVNILLEVGHRCATGDEDVAALLQQVAPFDAINRLHWSDWDLASQRLATADLAALVRGVTIAEEGLLGWSGGSVSAAIWVFRKLQERDAVLAEEMADWVLRHTTNPWLPFGTQNFGACSLAEYRNRSAHRQQQIKEGLDAQEASERRAAEFREKLTRQRHRAAQLWRTETRAAFLRTLEALPIPEQLAQLARDQEFPPQWYPTKLASAATPDVLAQLDEDIRLALLEKLKGRHRGPWGSFKTRLRASLGDKWGGRASPSDRKPWFCNR